MLMWINWNVVTINTIFQLLDIYINIDQRNLDNSHDY